MIKRKLSLFLCMVLLLGVFSPMALATEIETPVDDPIDPDPYTYISSIDIDLAIVSQYGLGRADCYSSAFVPDTTKTIYLDMHLQRRDIDSNDNSNSAWTTLKSWSASGTYRVTLDKSYYVTHGYTYRLLIGVTIRDPNDHNYIVETATAVSDYVKFQ